VADRPGETFAVPERVAGGGHQGPDQGYALKLVARFESEVSLRPGEHWPDVAAGAAAIAMKRASLFGRAPVRDDVEMALTMWGFLDDAPPSELVELRREAFAGIGSFHHYLEVRRLVGAVPTKTLRSAPLHVFQSYSSDWSLQLDLDALSDDESSREQSVAG
jgi:hypothetical protein